MPATDRLIRNAALGKALATKLGQHSIMLMRGHGSVAATKTNEARVGRPWELWKRRAMAK